MFDIRLALMTGADIPIPECQLTLHQPTMYEISMVGEREFFTGAQVLCMDKGIYIEDENALSEINNFQIFMTVMMEKSPAAMDKKAKVNAVLSILFPGY